MRLLLTLLFFVPLIGFSQYWQQQGQDIDGEAANDRSGNSVSMNAAGDRVAIGATLNDGNGGSSGHVRIYGWNGTSWMQLGQDIDGEAPWDQSGHSVSMNAAGDRVAIGTPWNDYNGNGAGHVRIYAWNGTAWIQQGQDIDGEAYGDLSGYSVSMNAAGDRVAIGAIRNDGNGADVGHVRIYYWNGTAWIQQGQDIDGEAYGDLSGYSVSMNAAGDRVAIGARYSYVNGNWVGHVRIYAWNASLWTQQGQDIDGEAAEDESGYSVSMNAIGDRVAIGAIGNDGNGIDAGHVRLYDWSGSSWVQLGQDIDGEAAWDGFGNSVSMNDAGDRVAIGAILNDGNSGTSNDNRGHVRLYDWSGSSWVQLGQDIDGEAAWDGFGNSVSMNDAGDRVAIGAILNDGNSGTSNDNRGHVRIYEWLGTLWVQQGQDIDGEAADDRSGYSVSMNAAGDRVAIGAIRNDGNGLWAGHVRIYSCNTELLDSVIVCDSTTWMDGVTYYSSTYSPTYILGPNSRGCDSVMRLNLTVNYSNSLSDTIIACNSYTWIDGNTYTSSTNTPSFMLSDIHGCDSLVNLDLTINYSNLGADTLTACDSYLWNANTYDSSGTFNQVLTNIHGCDSSVTLNLTIINSSTGTDSHTTCDSYTWIDGNTYTSSTNTPTYTLTNAAGCDSVVTLNLTVNTVNSSITNTTPTLTADATGATYQWLDCNNNYAPIPGETNQIFTATANGSYAVEVTQNGCVDTSACEQVNNVGINEINSSITLHPNPTTGVVELQGINGSFKVDVYDYAGKYLKSTRRSTIDLSDYPSGIYFFKVAYGDKTEELRVVKE